jgi:DNA-directed RNA polymerase specialized sigma24 family protein
MTEPDEFDQFYKDVRTRLLLLTYCLTGDLPASRSAVRDAFVVTWHHWRKVSRLDDPEAWVREHACRHAQRRHTAKLWHREKGLDAEVKATLDALGKLPVSQRRVLLLTELTTSSLADLAREVGLPRTEAERQLQTASATFALERDVPTTSIRAVLEDVRTHLDTITWPRPSIVRRAGAARRRTHTVIGVAATVAALVVTGTLVTEGAEVRPTLDGERASAGLPSSDPPVALPEDSLLGTDTLDRNASGPTWTVASTSDNTAGDGIVMPCQDSRYAGRRQPDAALVRVFGSEATGKEAAPRVVQAVQAAPTERAAKRSYDNAVDWFAACGTERAQLVGTYDVPGVGDAAMLFELHTWDKPEHTLVAGVARTGQFTTVTASSTEGKDGPGPRVVARMLGEGVDKLCDRPEGGACTTDPTPEPTDPVPAADMPGMLAEVDLPPARGVDEAWVATPPQRAGTNAAATVCDQTSFKGRGISNAFTRTFVVPEANLPAEFGLTETVGTMSPKRAKAFVEDVRQRLARCEDRQIGTDVTKVRDVKRGDMDLAVWKVTTEVTDDRSINYLMGIARDGSGVAQVGFVPVKGVDISADDFARITQRAQARLETMPAPSAR